MQFFSNANWLNPWFFFKRLIGEIHNFSSEVHWWKSRFFFKWFMKFAIIFVIEWQNFQYYDKLKTFTIFLHTIHKIQDFFTWVIDELWDFFGKKKKRRMIREIRQNLKIFSRKKITFELWNFVACGINKNLSRGWRAGK